MTVLQGKLDALLLFPITVFWMKMRRIYESRVLCYRRRVGQETSSVGTAICLCIRLRVVQCKKDTLLLYYYNNCMHINVNHDA